MIRVLQNDKISKGLQSCRDELATAIRNAGIHDSAVWEAIGGLDFWIREVNKALKYEAPAVTSDEG
jgi:hypothetical protein